MIEHCEEVMDGLDAKFGADRFQYLFLFDHSANHEAFASDALRANVVSKGWGGKQPKLRETEFEVHHAVPRGDIFRHPLSSTLPLQSRVKVKGWWSPLRGSTKWRTGTVVGVNDTSGWNKGTYKIAFDEPIQQSMCFLPRSNPPVSKWGGRGLSNKPTTHVGCAKGAHQTLWERGLAPAVFPRRAGVTSNCQFKQAVLKFLEDEGRVAAADHDTYCNVCAVHDEEMDEVVCPEGDLIDCTYCNHARHIHKCARLPSHVIETYVKSNKVPGVWACPDCIKAACDALDLDPPSPPQRDLDSDSDDEEECVENGIVGDTEEDSDVTESDLNSTAGVVFGMWTIMHLRMLLSCLPDFKAQQSRVAELIQSRGHICMFLPKFHCELNYIELYWCLSKWHTRGRADKSWKGLKKAIWEAFGVIPYINPTNKALPTNSIVRQRESRRAREYLAAYKQGCTVAEVDEVRNTIKGMRCGYKQHRVPSQTGSRDATPTTDVPLRRSVVCSKCGVRGHNRVGCDKYWDKKT